MSRDFAQGSDEQFFAGRKFVPGRCPGGMRQRNQIESMSGAADSEFTADYLFELCAIDELGDGQAADWNNESRFQDADLVLHPRGTITNLVWSRDAVAAAGILAGKTSTDCGEIDCRS